MVVGSEGGNDYAANAIVFAHGTELQSFAWMDEDMRSNRESEYYLGRYYTPVGGTPEKMTRQVPVKEEYRAISLNPAYNVPLYKLVYNNAVITGYHWDWSTLKISGEVETASCMKCSTTCRPCTGVVGVEQACDPRGDDRFSGALGERLGAVGLLWRTHHCRQLVGRRF